MGIFKQKYTMWSTVVPKNKESDLKPFLESVKVFLDENNNEINQYNSYLIATFSIFIPIYIVFLNFNISLLYYITTAELNLLIIILLIERINFVKKCNENMLNTYNFTQAKLGNCALIRIDGKRKDAMKFLNKLCKKYNLKQLDFDMNIKNPSLDKMN